MHIKRFIIKSKEIRAHCVDYVSRITSEPLLEVVIREYKENRTLEQNNYLWGVVYPEIRKFMFETTGEDGTCEEWHEVLKVKFAEPKIIEKMGVSAVKYTTTGSKKKFNLYLDRLFNYFAELGLNIPSPDQGLR